MVTNCKNGLYSFLSKCLTCFQEAVIFFFFNHFLWRNKSTSWFFEAVYRSQCSGMFKAQNTTDCQITNWFICYHCNVRQWNWSAAGKQKKGFWADSLAFLFMSYGLGTCIHCLKKDLACSIFSHINNEILKIWIQQNWYLELIKPHV